MTKKARTPHDDEELGPSRVHRLLGENKPMEALGALIVVLSNKALETFNRHDSELFQGPDYEAATPMDLQLAVAAKARAVLEKSRDGLSAVAIEQMEHACEVLDACYLVRYRLEKPIGGGQKAVGNVLAELVFMGGLLGQSDFGLECSIAGVWQDAERARRQREGRKRGANGTALKRTSWKGPALETAREICSAQPGISSAQLASRVSSKLNNPLMPVVPLLAFLRTCRKNGKLPTRA